MKLPDMTIQIEGLDELRSLVERFERAAEQLRGFSIALEQAGLTADEPSKSDEPEKT